MQYKVDSTCQTRENGHKPDGSFKTAYASHKYFSQKSTRFFPDMRFSRGFHRKSEFSFYTIKSDHSRLTFPSKSAQSWKTLKNGCFWHCIVIIEWLRFFPGNPAVSLFFPYHPLTLCKKAKRSYAPFSVTFANTHTDGSSQAWPQLKLRTVTS